LTVTLTSKVGVVAHGSALPETAADPVSSTAAVPRKLANDFLPAGITFVMLVISPSTFVALIASSARMPGARKVMMPSWTCTELNRNGNADSSVPPQFTPWPSCDASFDSARTRLRFGRHIAHSATMRPCSRLFHSTEKSMRSPSKNGVDDFTPVFTRRTPLTL
jgi:hypothetical protein